MENQTPEKKSSKLTKNELPEEDTKVEDKEGLEQDDSAKGESDENPNTFKVAFGFQVLSNEDFSQVQVVSEYKDEEGNEIKCPQSLIKYLLKETLTMIDNNELMSSIEQAVGSVLTRGNMVVKDPSGREQQVPISYYLSQLIAQHMAKIMSDQMINSQIKANLPNLKL